jgi:hypothetical protein
LKLEFRSNAQTKNIYILNVGIQLCYIRSLKKKKSKISLSRNHEKVFFDSMQFWNNKEGIAMGDIACLNVIITRDGEIHGVKYLQINYQK